MDIGFEYLQELLQEVNDLRTKIEYSEANENETEKATLLSVV